MIDLDRFFLIAGPCVIESYDHLMKVASHIQKTTDKLGIQWVLKSSYDKANRTSIDSYRGPGIEKGISILNKVKFKLECPITTDFHSVEEIKHYGTTVDIVQIPAFLSRQTDILVAAGKTGKPVNVKKGQFINPEQIPSIVKKVGVNCFITERGTQCGDDVIVDFRNLWRVDIIDVTHTVKHWSHSGYLARAGIAIGVNGVFCEVGSTLCDKEKSIPLSYLNDFAQNIKEQLDARSQMR